MESSWDEEEECRSSESGWTMYIESPMEEDSRVTNGDDDEAEGEEVEEQQSDGDNVGSVDGGKEGDSYVGGEDSDDSMASDASSHPIHPGKWEGKGCKVKSRKNLRMGKK